MVGSGKASIWARWAAALVLVAAIMAACGSGDDDDDANGGAEGANLTVVTSTSIIGALVGEVAGEHATVTALMGPGVDPHVFETTPGDARTISGADIAFVNGLELDDFLIDDILGANADLPIVVVTEGIDLIEGGHRHDEDDHDDEHDEEDEHHDEDDHDDEHDEHDEEDEHHDEDDHDDEHGEYDPHVWQDPLRAKVMVANIAAALGEIDPDNTGDYQANAEAYQAVLDGTHEQIQALVDEIPAENRKLVTNHDALAYFAQRYGLEVVGTVIPGTTTEADPSAGELAELTRIIEREGVKAIFAEQIANPRVAEQLASDTGIEIVLGLYTDQVGGPGSGAETLHEMLLDNARRISDALR